MKDNDIGNLLDKRNTFLMSKEGMFVKNARVILDAKQGKPFFNKETGIMAILSATGKNKMISNAAAEKSVRNGFAISQHNEVASKVDKLFEYAFPLSVDSDKRGSLDIKSIKRFVAPVVISDECGNYTDASCLITLKESAGKNDFEHRMYSVEEIKIEQISLKGAELSDDGNLIHTPSALIEKITEEIEKVKDFDRKISVETACFGECKDKNGNREDDVWNVANTLIDWGCDTLGAAEMMRRLFDSGYEPENLKDFFKADELGEEYEKWSKEEGVPLEEKDR